MGSGLHSAEISRQLACKGALGGLRIQELGDAFAVTLGSGWMDKRAHMSLPKETVSLPNKQLELCYGSMSSLWLCPGTPAFAIFLPSPHLLS